MSPTQYTIGELSREFDVTTRTIRFYEDQGLLAPQREGQQRIYSPRDRVRLRLILRGKRLGFSLKDVQEMLEMYDAPQGEVGQLRDFISRMRRRRHELEQQRDEILVVLGELDALEQRCQRILDQSARTDSSCPPSSLS